jgi:starch phosphorylase
MPRSRGTHTTAHVLSERLDMHTEFLDRSGVAHFSMEVARHPGCSTYAGGFGVLAGDLVRSAPDLNLPLVAVTLVNRNGCFRQTLVREGAQQEASDP